MPFLTEQLTPEGAVVDLLVGVHDVRRTILERNSLPVPARVRVRAQIDTGTSCSAIDAAALTKLGTQPIDSVPVRTPSTTQEPQRFDQYAVSLTLAEEGVEMYLGQMLVIQCVFSPDEGIQALLGREVLAHCLFVYDGKRDAFSLAF